MSRGFVKEDDLEHAGTDVPERPISVHANYVTTNGYALLEQQANDLDKQWQLLTTQKENAAAMAQLAIVNRDLRYVSARLESALVTKPNLAAQQVLFGAHVTVEDESGKQHRYQIVGEDEADISANKIAYTSPLAKALIGQNMNETVTWLRPAGNQQLSIIAVNYIA